MLFCYFLQRFYRLFFIFFATLLIIFASSNLLVRLPVVGSLKAIPIIFGSMVPLIALFAVPIASCVAIQVVVGNSIIQQESLFFMYSKQARLTLVKAVLFFSLSISIFYIPLVFEWAPKSYSTGKELLVKLAKNQIFELEENKMHTVFPGCMIFFKKRCYANIKEPIFESIFLVFHGKNNSRYLFTAQKGSLTKDVFSLYNGHVCSTTKNKQYQASFEQTEICLANILDEKKENKPKTLKFCTWQELQELKQDNHKAVFEMHKRVAHAWWQLLLPLVALLAVFSIRREKNNLMHSLFFSSFIFLLMYVFFTFGNIFSHYYLLTYFCMYASVCIILMIFYFLYRQKV